jgi:hypothetical protein
MTIATISDCPAIHCMTACASFNTNEPLSEQEGIFVKID